MTAVGIIPARYPAVRFPGKPLAKINGRPMIEWVWEGASKAKTLRKVIVATDDKRILEACRSFGAEAVLTSPDHPTGTDRIAEIAKSLDDEIIVNIQGDEPLMQGFVIDALVRAIEADPQVPMATVVHSAGDDALKDPNRVKAVIDQHGYAMYFSRSTIPYPRIEDPTPRVWQHVGLYAYRRDFLLKFVTLPRTPAEQTEGLEQLRALEHGYKIRVAPVEGWESVAVDVPEDIGLVEYKLHNP